MTDAFDPRGLLSDPLAGPEDNAPRAPGAARPSVGRVVKGEFRVLGLLSIAVGSLLLLETMGILEGVHALWPVFPAFVGTGLVLAFFQRGRREVLMFGMGAYILSSSAVFFACNFTSWDILASAWPLFIALLGLVSALASIFAGRRGRVLWLSGLLLVMMAVVLYLVFKVTTRLWPLSLVLFGGWTLIVTRAGRKGVDDGE